MKTITLLTFNLLFCFIVNAQDYSPFYSNRIANYTTGNSSSHYFVKVDSSYIDTLGRKHYCFTNTYIDRAPFCFDCGESYCFNGNFLGEKAIKTNNNDYIFINTYRDSIYFDSNANILDTSLFFKNDTLLIKQVLQKIEQKNILGITDSVKYFKLIAYDSTLNQIAFPYSIDTFKLSKNYGIVEAFNFNSLPYRLNYSSSFFDTIGDNVQQTYFAISGISNPDMGIKDINAYEIYDFNIGDEFHYSGYFGNNYKEYSISKILSRTDSIDATLKKIIIYRLEIKSACYCPYGGPPLEFRYNVGYDTLLVDSNNILNKMSSKFYNTSHVKLENLNTKTISIWDAYRINGFENNCMTREYRGSVYTDRTYKKGLGLFSYEAYSYNKYMVYYKKDTLEWGNPINLSDYVGIANKQNLLFKMYPNPAESILLISSNDLKLTSVEFYNLEGKLVFSNQINSIHNYIDIGSLSKGFYVVKLTSDEDIEFQRLIIE